MQDGCELHEVQSFQSADVLQLFEAFLNWMFFWPICSKDFKCLIKYTWYIDLLVRAFPRAPNEWSIGALLASLPAGASTCSPRTAEFLHDFNIYLPCQRHDLFDTRTRTTSNCRCVHFAHASRHSMHPFRLSGTFRPFLSKGKLINRPSSPVPSSPHAFRERSIGASLASSPAEA